MNAQEANDGESDPLSVLDVTVDNVVQVLLGCEEEVHKLTERKQNLDSEVEDVQETLQQIKIEKADVEDQITRLKLRNASYQREHTNLRNAITILRFQIGTIEEHVEKEKEKAMNHLKDFEEAVDAISAKFRSGPDDHAREKLLSNLKEERDFREKLLLEIEALNNTYLELLNEKGLKIGRKADEEMIEYVASGSELFDLIQIGKNLDLISSEIQELVRKEKATFRQPKEQTKEKVAGEGLGRETNWPIGRRDEYD